MSGAVDFAQLVKFYGQTPAGAGHYSPLECVGIRKILMSGTPKEEHVSTSLAERQSLVMPRHFCRFTRLTNGPSRSISARTTLSSLTDRGSKDILAIIRFLEGLTAGSLR